ncbi:hypothetical protein [Streptomyces sp. Go-475]|uniref:hypothetical protein n=1 Tax=Streptomyces sp. Go-475 TaxID=2072505 RepID=UPI00130070D1|nr:hypothetical protein [Streptomyces sp. Go-475]
MEEPGCVEARVELTTGSPIPGTVAPPSAQPVTRSSTAVTALSDDALVLLAILTGTTTTDDVLAAHEAGLAEWKREQELRRYPELAVLDADLDRMARRS